MLAPEILGAFAGGVAVGGGACLGFMRMMISSALSKFELNLRDKFDRRYVMLPQRQER